MVGKVKVNICENLKKEPLCRLFFLWKIDIGIADWLTYNEAVGVYRYVEYARLFEEKSVRR